MATSPATERRQRTNRTLLAILIVTVQLALLIVAYGWYRQEPRRKLRALQTQVSALTVGAIRYAQDHQDHYPSSENWPTQLAPYVEAKYLRDTHRIAMNRALSNRSLESIDDPTSAILFFESTCSPSADVDAIPLQTASGAFAVSFADGHGYERSTGERASLIKFSHVAPAPAPSAPR